MENESVKEAEATPPKRVLFLADFACSTGFATVAQNIVREIVKTGKYQIDVVGINYYGMPTEWQALYPTVRLLPSSVISGGDLFGRQGTINLLSAGVYDIFFCLQDTFQIEPMAQKVIEQRNAIMSAGGKPFRWIFYFPIDAKPMENWITKSAALADIPVAYTQYGKNEAVKAAPYIATKIKVIPHGTDINSFFKIEGKGADEFKHNFFNGKADGKFLVTNVNRNQQRKDIPRTMQIFKYFKQQCPDAMLYLHMNKNDVGGDIDEIARNFELAPDLDYIVPKSFNEHDGVPVSILNAIYNVSDVVMTTTMGEGWGLSMTEAMAAGTPVIAPNHTSLTEMLADDRGVLVSAGKRLSDWVVYPNDMSRMRPIVDVGDYVDKLVKMRQNYDEYKGKAEKTRQWVIDNWNWDKVGQMWRDTFEEALSPKQKVNIGRNDPCYCGSGKKYKNCHLPYES